MATTTSTFSNLPLPTAEDSMEMSSPAVRNLDDDDIEIDFDDYQAAPQVGDDERMLEDGETRPTTATDDMMEDDILPGEQALVQEDVMRDDGVHIEEDDEELIDYGDDEFHDQLVEDTILPGEVEAPLSVTAPGEGPVVADTVRAADAAATESAVVSANDEFSAGVVGEPDLLATTGDVLDPLTNAEDGSQAQASDAAHEVPATETVILGPGDDTYEDEDTSQQVITIDTALSTDDNTPGTPTDTGLHPMTIRYGDLSMPLFKSRRQLDGLLKDDNLASLSLAELIKNCRQRLAIKIGEDISEDQELVLGFDRLGLMLVEDSRAAFESSLNDILEVYLQLYRNDDEEDEDIPPLPLTLTLQLKFASSLAIFKQAVAGGQGMSNFNFLQPAAREEYLEEGFQDDQLNPSLHGLDGAGEFYPSGENEEEAGDYEQEHFGDQEEYYNQDNEGETYDDNDDGQEPPPGLEDILQGEQQSTHALYNAPDEPEEGEQNPAVVHSAVAESDAQLAVAAPAEAEDRSAASSTTIQEDAGQDTSAPTADGEDDFSTFLEEFDEEEKEAANVKDVQQILDSGEAGPQVSAIAALDDFDSQPHASEKYLNDFGDQTFEEEGQYPDQEGDDHGEDYADNEGEPDFDQADTYDEQQEESYNPDYQPGEEDDQFHTAQDFLHGDYYEHGPEHDPVEDEAGLDDTAETVLHHQVDDLADENAHDDAGIDFDWPEEEVLEEHEDDHVEPSQHSETLRGKRSFDEHADEDDFEDEEPDLKKARAG